MPIIRRPIPPNLLINLRYDPTSLTCLRWANAPPGRAKVGAVAGGLRKSGYGQIFWEGTNYLIHRIVWELHYGPISPTTMIDHINRNTHDNRIQNLRLASNGENRQNATIGKNNRTGVKGLSLHRNGTTWCGTIGYQGQRYVFNNKNRALVEQWLIDTRQKLHGQFSRHQ